MKPAAIASVLVLLLGATPAEPQGRTAYLNPESPQVHPIEVARVGGHDVLLVELAIPIRVSGLS